MKIGIVTFFCVPNYGAMLQAYALWKYLEGRGHEVEFIDYAFGNTRRIPLWKCFIARHLSNCLEVVRKKLKSHVSFDIVRFSDKFPRTRRILNYDVLKDVGKNYDVVVVGSDQMWNPMWCSKDALPVVMLDFVRKGAKRVSYAASFGTQQWRQDQNATLAGQLLKKFDAISVREQSGVELVRTLSGRNDAKWLLDPTMLHSTQAYRKLFSGAKEKQRYVFSYILSEWAGGEDIGSIIEIIKEVREVNEVRSERIPVKGFLSGICKILNVTSKVSVPEWVALLFHADFVVTNSFHGTVFSLLFNKPFLTIPVSGTYIGMNERITSLLEALRLESRIIIPQDVTRLRDITEQPIDWNSVNIAMSMKRSSTDEFFEHLGM